MAILNSGFFNATMVDGVPDRVYTAEQVNDFLKGLVSQTGIFATISSACHVVAGSGMNVILKSGRGIVGGNWFEVDKDITITLPPSDVVLNRICSVVISRSNVSRETQVTLKLGSLATNPTPPSLTRNDEIYEICLANITINKNTSSITSEMIQDTRSNNDVCGWIVGLIDEFDTRDLFIQYQEAQDSFINEKTNEFNNWFDNAKENVKSTSLYREYKHIYSTVNENEQTFNIPSTINYEHNSIDVLELRVNGFMLAVDEYSINQSDNTVSLSFPLDLAGTRVEFVNKKSVEGVVSESTITRVEELESRLNSIDEIHGVYEATGANDNIKLADIVRNFLNGSGDYASVKDTEQLYIKVNGTLGISYIDTSYIFDFNNSKDTLRRVVLDFGNATIPEISTTNVTAISVFNANKNVKVINACVYLEQTDKNNYIYGLYGGEYDNVRLHIDSTNKGTVYACYGCDNVSNSEITIENAPTNAYGMYSCEKALFNKVTMNAGTSIKAFAKQIAMGNIVNTTINADTNAVNIGNVM